MVFKLIQTSKIHWHQFTYPRLLHSHPIDYIHRAHGHFIMGDYNELGIFAELPNHVGKLTHIRIIQGCVYFIQYAKWGWFNQVDRKQQCRSREGLLSPLNCEIEEGRLPFGFATISIPVSARFSGLSSTISAVSSSLNNDLNTFWK